MDKNIVDVEESQLRNDSPASASKPLGSLVQINSIAIDLSCAMEEIESPLHEHFSIRGFVAGMRKKDRKMCLPFTSLDVNDDSTDNLPPISVPRFRWWQCSTCVPDFTAESTALQMVLADRSNAGTSSCQHVDREKEVLVSHNRQSIVCFEGNGHVIKKSIDGEDNNPSSKGPKANPKCKGHKAITSIKKKTDFRNEECGTTYVRIPEATPIRLGERHDKNADVCDTIQIAENDCIRFVEPDNVSSRSDAAGCALPRRRKPKLRSLADIMEEENNSKSEHIKLRSALSSGMNPTFTYKEGDLHHHPELETSADVATVTRSPHRKRNIAGEEDRGPLHATNPLGTAKRSKGLIPDSEKRHRVPEISDSESGRDGSSQSDLQLSAKNQQHKIKRNKALEFSRKMKHHGDKRTVHKNELPKTSSMFPKTLQRRCASIETGCGNMENASATLREEMEPYLSSLIPGKQVERTFDKSRSKRPEVEVDLRPVVPPRKSFIGDCSVQGKVALELSLNSYTAAEINTKNQISSGLHRGIPDLNESFTEKSSSTQWKQLLTSENGCSVLHKNSDMVASSSKQMAAESKRKFIVSEPQAVQKIHSNNVESGGTSDDIPMDIVELLAKNQRERSLENSRNHLLASTTNNSSVRGSPTGYVDRRPSFVNFPLTNARNGLSVTSGEMRFSNGILSFPQVEENQFRLFSSYKPCQQEKTQYSASNPLYSGPRASEGADLLWPPRRKNSPFHLDVHHNHSVQHNGLDMKAFPNQSYKSKTISDTKGEVRRGVREVSKVKENRTGLSTKSSRSLDAYSNDTIPAMQLLSLMDRGIVSGSSFKVGSNSFQGKPFSPCNHHPRLNANEKQNDRFLNGSFLSQGSSRSKAFPPLLNGARFPGETSKKSYAQGHMFPPQGNRKSFNSNTPDNLVLRPSRGDAELQICTLNRNPADFSIPDAKNEYTISARDLKTRKRHSLKVRSRAVNLEVPKRGRAKKYASGREFSRK